MSVRELHFGLKESQSKQINWHSVSIKNAALKSVEKILKIIGGLNMPSEKKEQSLYQNQVFLAGELLTEFKVTERVPNYRKNLYEAMLRVRRNNGLGKEDDLPILVHKDVIAKDTFHVRDHIFLRGRLESFRVNENFRRREIYFLRGAFVEKTNRIDYSRLNIAGFLCADPIIRPLVGGSGSYNQIAELTISVTRRNPIIDPFYGTKILISDYIHAIVFNEEAEKAKEYKTGDHIEGYGRIQSRMVHGRYPVYELMLAKHTVDSSINSIEMAKKKRQENKQEKRENIPDLTNGEESAGEETKQQNEE